MKIIVLVVFSILLLMTGCSSKVLTPYEDKALCDCGQGKGYCGSVSNVYETTKEMK